VTPAGGPSGAGPSGAGPSGAGPSGAGPSGGSGAGPGEPQPLEARFDAPDPVDLLLSLAPLQHGSGDATIHFGRDGVWLARRTAAGPASLRIWTVPGEAAVRAQAWGPGASLALEAVPGLAGLLDDPSQLVAHHPLVGELQRRFPGLRLPRTGQLLGPLVAAVIGQKVTFGEAHAGYARLLRRLGDPAPGPMALVLAPTGARLATLPYFEFHPMGLERRRAELLRQIGRLEWKIEALTSGPPNEAYLRLQEIPGIGPWTAAEATRVSFGDPDAVSLGDAHLPDLVAWALAGEPRADDTRMLELIAPYMGQRGRVVGLLKASRIKIPRYGPRFTPRDIERL
jgi:3-methyladenine DNA glycosylase/8-oxoguanine DNA glycosylase